MHYKTHRTFSHLLCFRGKLENSHKAVLVRQPEAGRLGDPTKGQKFQNEFMKSSFLPKYERKIVRISALQCTEVGFARFLSGGFITAIVVNQPERKLAKRKTVQWCTGQKS